MDSNASRPWTWFFSSKWQRRVTVSWIFDTFPHPMSPLPCSLTSELPGMELDNQYVLKNSNHQPILLASENTGFCCRCFFAAARAFEVNVYDDRGNRVINIERRFTFGLCCICGICCGNVIFL